ncbi:MAG: hypothetical protein EAX89_01910 [Candidatus Lokiarchaeota archaeon]|nr:hypothetical protein [Candidatus Lokiarchaeota archaeon]
MKSKSKISIIVLCTLVFALSFSSSYVIIPRSRIQYSNPPVNNLLKMDCTINHLRISEASNVITIDNNWTAAIALGICTGNGTYTDPYIIKNVTISNFYGTAISITNSNEHFRIENCTICNSTGPLAYAITLKNTQNGIITNNSLFNIQNGIYLFNSHNATIYSNIINGTGIHLDESNYINISDNLIVRNGISMITCEYNSLSRNSLSGDGLYIDAALFNGNWTRYLHNIAHHDIDSTNLVNDKPLYYYNNKVNLNYDDFLNAGQVFLANCNDSIISNLSISHTSKAISLYLCNDIILTNSTVSYNTDGIYLKKSDNNLISENTLIQNSYFNIHLDSSKNNQIKQNTAVGLSTFGGSTGSIYLSSSQSNVINENSLTNYTLGIELKYSSKNTISANKLTKCHNGIQLFQSYYNTISKNTLDKSYNGILLLYDASNNVISDNKIINYDHRGIYLSYGSDYNSVTGNTITGNGACIVEFNCKGNSFWANGGCIYGYPADLIITLSILIGPIILAAVLYRIIRKKHQSRSSLSKSSSTTETK